MARKQVPIYWYIVPVVLLVISVFVAWRSGKGSVGVLDAFDLGSKPPEYIVAKTAFVGAFILAAGVLGLFLTQRSGAGVTLGSLVGVMAAVFVAIGVTAYTDLQGPTGDDGRHLSLGMPLYVLGCVATLLLAIQVVRGAPGRDDATD